MVLAVFRVNKERCTQLANMTQRQPNYPIRTMTISNRPQLESKRGGVQFVLWKTLSKFTNSRVSSLKCWTYFCHLQFPVTGSFVEEGGGGMVQTLLYQRYVYVSSGTCNFPLCFQVKLGKGGGRKDHYLYIKGLCMHIKELRPVDYSCLGQFLAC